MTLLLGKQGSVQLNVTPTRPAVAVRFTLNGALLPSDGGSVVSDPLTGPFSTRNLAVLGAVNPDGTVTLYQLGAGYALAADGETAVVSSNGDGGTGLTRLALTRTSDPYPFLSIPFAPARALPFTLTLTSEDVQTLTHTSGLYTLVAAFDYADGSSEQQITPLQLDLLAPKGRVVFDLAPGYGGYLSYRQTDADTQAFLITWEAGDTTTQPLTRSGEGLLGVVRATGDAPLSVRGLDLAGNVGDNLLESVNRPLDLRASGTVLSPWPLPPYLKADTPHMSVLLATFAEGLDLNPEGAAQQANPLLAADDTLDLMAGLFGLTRMNGEPDGDLRVRVLQVLVSDMGTRHGLGERLGALLRQQVLVQDGLSILSDLRQLDGTWRLDGSVHLGGVFTSLPMGPGRLRALFSEAPADWDVARRFVNRYRAAGVIVSLTSNQKGGEGTAFRIGAGRGRFTVLFPLQPVTLAPKLFRVAGSLVTGALRIDGSWQLDGTKQLGAASGQQVLTTL